MKRILCFGDSLTWGFIPGSGERYDETKRWTKLLQKKLGNHYEIIENGISGRVSSYDPGRNPYQCGRTGLGFALCESAPTLRYGYINAWNKRFGILFTRKYWCRY